MTDEVKLYKRYLRLNKKLALSKNWEKQRRIVEPIYGRSDYEKFDFVNHQEILQDDLAVFK